MDEQSKDSLGAEIKNANEVIKKLQNFANELVKTSDNNILTHLCDGLQTFLGYDKDSKGYNGTGIVYSDLDRLCDAVMGFLSGVLEAVKDDDAVKNYEKYINVGNRFDAVVQYLKNAIGKGSTELPTQFEKVSGCLSEYRSQVETLTDGVRRGLRELSNDISGKHINCVAGEGVKSLGDQLSNWSKVLGELQTDVKNIETSNINVLDSSLKTKLVHEIQPMKSTLTMLEESAANGTLITQMRHVDEELVKQHKHVSDEIHKIADEVQTKLSGGFRKIFDNIENLNRTKENDFININDRMRDTQIFLNNFERLYKNPIHELLTQLKCQMVNINQQTNPSKKRDQSELKEHFNEMTKTLELIKSDLHGENKNLEEWKSRAQSVVTAALSKTEEIYQGVKSDNCAIKTHAALLKSKAQLLRKAADKAIANVKQEVSEALRAVVQMDGKLKEDLKKMKDGMQSALSKLAEILSTAVKNDLVTLESNVKGVFGTLKDDTQNFFNKFESTKKLLTKCIQVLSEDLGKLSDLDKVGTIDSLASKTTLLQAIKKGVAFQPITEYMTKLDSDVMTPLKTALDNMGRNWYSGYKYEIDVPSIKALKSIMETPGVLPTLDADKMAEYGIAMSKSFTQLNLQATSLNIHTIITDLNTNSLSKQNLENIFRAIGTIGKAVSDQSKAIVIEVMNKMKEKVPDEIKTVAEVLATKSANCMKLATQASVAAKSFGFNDVEGPVTGLETLLRNFDSTIKSVIDKLEDNVSKQFNKTRTGQMNLDGDDRFMHEFKQTRDKLKLGQLANEDTTVDDILKDLFPGESNGKVTLQTKKWFAQYNSHVDQDGVDAIMGNDVAGPKGHLPREIKAVDNDGLKDLEAEEIRAITESTFDSAVKSIEEQLAKLNGLICDLGGANFDYGNVNDKGVRTLLRDFDKMLTKENAEGVYGLESGLTKIKRQLVDLHNRISQVTTSASEAIDPIIESLETLPAAVEDAQRAANERMDDLKSQLDKNLFEIRSVVAQSESMLKSAIDDVHDAVQTAQQTAKASVSHFQSQISKEVQQAFFQITAQVQSLFARQQIADLEALQSLVERQSRKMEHIIQRDRRTGAKGLLQSLTGCKYIVKIDKYPRFEMTTRGSLLDAIIHVAKSLTSKLNGEQYFQLFKTLSTECHSYFTNIHTYVKTQLIPQPEALTPHKPTSKHGPQPAGRVGYSGPVATATTSTTKNPIAEHLDRLHYYVNGLFGTLSAGYFGRSFDAKRNDLANFLSSIRPSTFAGIGSPLFDILTRGLRSLTTELGKAYISTYDTAAYSYQWTVDNNSENCAKVFLTILNTLCEDLPYLENKCKENSKYSWKHRTISEYHDNKENALGCYLKGCGYAVAKDEHSKDGELNIPDRKYMGGHIYQKLNELKFGGGSTIFQHLVDCVSNVNEEGKKIKEDNFTIFELLKCLLHHADEYNAVGHLCTMFAKRQPCTVYEMLAWCSGLTYNPVYHELTLSGFTSLLDKPKNKGSDGNKHEDEEEEGPTVEDSTALGLDAYPSDITFNSVHDTITHITSQCHDILTTIVGTGDAETVYACDYSNNYLALSYPADPAQCFETLLDILRRLLPQLRYLSTKCSTKAEHNGWRNCEYGKDVPTSKSHCNEQPSDKVTSKAACQPTCQANSKVNCQPTSPLMSYLNDCLPGHLPHHVTSIGCKSVCSNCPRNKPGQPCLTPLGFRGFSCSTRTGRHLYDILVTFLGDVDLSRLLCLLPKPPATLPEHFGFALSLVNGWKNGSKYNPKTLRDNIESSIASSSIKLYVNPENFTNVMCNAYRTTHTTLLDKNHLPQYADLSSLAMPTVCTAADVKCAPYLSSLSCDSYYHLAKKNAGLYLSWITYLPWTFWDLLNNLYNAFCSINCQDWGCRGCLRGDKCKKGEHGVVDEEKPSANCQCRSTVDCKGVAPTLYQYGFVFGEASTLNGESPKKCSDFCSQLKNVLNSEYFKKLFKECDNFLWKIREPFSYLVLALWSASFVYLLYVYIGRLDTLHIRSHLRLPSSHKIAAQSLLAAARIGKLAKISYLQP